jgi:MipA family protein
MISKNTFLTAFLLAITSTQVCAENVHWGFGLAAEYGPDYPGASDSSVSPSPLIERLEDDEVFYSDLQLGPRIGLFDAGAMEFGLAIDFRDGRDREDLPTALQGLSEIDLAVELGGYAAWDLEPFLLRVDALVDVAGAHEGVLVTPAFEWYSDSEAKFRTVVGIGADWTSSDYQNTYFGISANEASLTRLAQFDPDSGFSRAFVQAGFAYDLNQSWALSAVLAWSKWLGDARDSPITKLGDDSFASAEIGVIRFF